MPETTVEIAVQYGMTNPVGNDCNIDESYRAAPAGKTDKVDR